MGLAVNGLFRTMEMHYNCDPGGGGNKAQPAPKPVPGAQGQVLAAPPGCVWDNTHVVYLPKGVVRRYLSRKIIEERDASGNATTFGYTTFGDGYGTYLSTVTDPVGRQISYAWEHSFQKCVQWSIENDCVQWKWVYRVQRVTDSTSGRSSSYSYDSNGLITSVTNGAGRTTSYAYTNLGLAMWVLTGVTNARSNTTSFTWTGGPPLRVTQVTAPGGAATVHTHTVVDGRITRTVVRDALNHSTTYDIYAGGDSAYNGNLERVTDPLGNLTQYAYDNRHNVTQVTDPRGNRTTYQYNSRNKVTQVVQAVGSLNLTTTATWDSNDNILSVTNARGIRTEYTYNSAHRVTSIRRAVGTADESLTQYTYNGWGGLASVIDPLNHTTTYAYTAHRQIQTVTPPVGGTTTYGYNAADDQVTMTNGNGRTWTTAYDLSRLVTSVTDPQNNVIRSEYDNNGNRIRTYDGKNQLTTFNYDNRDRLTSIVDPLNGTTAYQYDAVGNLTRITNARNNQTNFTYDTANRLTQVRDALNQTTTYGYDAAGNRTSMQDRKGTNHAYTYDQANRLTQVAAGGTTISYTYNATANRLTMVDPTGTTSYQYDSLDRLTRTTYPDGRTVQTAYDDAGNRTNLTYPGGTVSQGYTYDAANRLSRITQGTLQWNFSYDGAGNRTQLTQPNGTSTIYTYLTNNWLQSIEHRAPGGATLQAFTYTYDANGNRLTQVDSTGTTSFTYDTLNRLTQAAYPAGYGNWSWSYDAVGNRTQQVAPGGTTGYTYDANNRLTQAASVIYSYDANGNLTTTSAGQTFTYNPFNQMTQATGPGGTVTHTFNGDGLKTRRVGPDGTTKYYYDGILPIWETDSGGAMTSQLDRDIFGNLLSRNEPTARRYYHFDGLGSTTALTNESGTVVATMLYDAWGLQRTSSGSGHGKYRFTGTEFDSATGLYHMGARFYDPTIGRWLNEDPSQDAAYDPASLNFYSYVQNNPIGGTDPSGLQTCDLACLNEQRQAQAMVAPSTEAYLAWLHASQMGVTPPAGWERYIGYVLAASRQTGVDPALILAVMAKESGGKGYNPRIRGGAGEIGLMQLKLATAGDYGITTASQLEDPATNILTGARHLAHLLGLYRGSQDQITMAISAYQQGEGSFARYGLARNPGYWMPVLQYLRWFRLRFP